MSKTIQEVKDNLELSKQRTQALIDQANATTGNKDTDLASAVGSLVEGFGQGEDSGEDYGLQLLNGTITEIPPAWKDITKIRDYAFYGCTSITSIDFKNAINIGDYAFATKRGYPMNYTLVNLPKAQTIGQGVFSTYNSKTNYPIEVLYLPEVTVINHQSFGFAWNLKNIILPKVTTLATQCTCEMLGNLILPQNHVVSLPNITKINQSATYVPSSLLDEYKSATNWSALSSTIYAIEDSEEILALLEDVGYEYASMEV